MTNSRRSTRPKLLKLTVLALSLILAVTSLSARSQTGDAPTVKLQSVEAQPVPEGSGTRITFHGSHPLSYSASSPEGGSWTLMMEGVDCREVQQTMAVESPVVSQVVIRPVAGAKGGAATRVDFELAGNAQRQVHLDGNDLMVDVSAAPAPAKTEEAPRPQAVPAVATSTPPVVTAAAQVPAPVTRASSDRIPRRPRFASGGCIA
jgi:hypothetical protein